MRMVIGGGCMPGVIGLLTTISIVNFSYLTYGLTIQENVQNLVDSLTTNRSGDAEFFRKNLKLEVDRERYAFDKVEEEMRIARTRLANRQSNLYSKSHVDVVAIKRNTEGENHDGAPVENACSNTELEVSESPAKLRLYGDSLAKLQSLKADVSDFVATYEGPLSKMPNTLKYFRKITTKSAAVSSSKSTRMRTIRTSYSYKVRRTYPSNTDRRESVYAHFLKVFSFNNDTMKQKLISMNTGRWKGYRLSPCTKDTYTAFKTHCTYSYYTSTLQTDGIQVLGGKYAGGLKKMKGLLHEICSTGWMTTEMILHIIRSCCQARFKHQFFEMNALNSNNT